MRGVLLASEQGTRLSEFGVRLHGFEKVGVVKAGRECRREANVPVTDKDAIFGEVRGEAVPVMTL